MRKKPKALILSGYGLNCEEETKYAFDQAGAEGDIVHINDLIRGTKKLTAYHILALPGGFSYGDDTGSGNAFANKIKNHLSEQINTFIQGDHLAIGICNGFQILARLQLFPVSFSLTHNDSARYMVRWVDIRVENNSPWLQGVTTLSLPIAHGEGKLYVDAINHSTMNQKNMVALRYVEGEICRYQKLAPNPNGSFENIAGITDESGRLLGLMPHPERALFFTNLPHWPYLKQLYMREKKLIPQNGPGLSLFKNAVNYFL